MPIADPGSSAALDWTIKGILPAWEGLTIAAAMRSPVSLFDDRLMLPVATLRRDIVQDNSRWMRRFLDATGVQIAPHGKTSMTPELFRLQEADGIWGMTAATPHHVRAYRQFGVKRVLLANQLVGQGSLDWVIGILASDPAFDFHCLVDSVEGVELIERACEARAATRRIQVLIEVGRAGGRAGVRSKERGLEVARSVARSKHVALLGISTFEGIVPASAGAAGDAGRMIEDVAALAEACDREQLFGSRIILSGGGSAFFDLVANLLPKAHLSQTPEVVIRSGCYLSHDDGLYRKRFEQLMARRGASADGATGAATRSAGTPDSGLRSALEVWAHVQSIPEPGRMICTLGKRDVGNDIELPVLKAWFRPGERTLRPAPQAFKVVALNDQHAYVDGPAEDTFRVGDIVGFGISHPCTTFDKWRALLVVDHDYRVVDLVRTYF